MVLARVVIHVLARVLPHVLARVLLHVLARVIIHVHDYYSKTCLREDRPSENDSGGGFKSSGLSARFRDLPSAGAILSLSCCTQCVPWKSTALESYGVLGIVPEDFGYRQCPSW